MQRLPYSTQCIENDDIDGVIEVLKSSFLTQGNKVKEFENALCTYTGAKHAITFNSATSALFGAYSIVNITQDDEIITTPISFVATSNMFLEFGAKPVWCDVKMDGNIDEEKIESLITPKTKAIVVVDFAGNPVAHTKIQKIATQHALILIDDASHALGSSINNRKIGSLSDMTIFSFHAIKPITTGEGGAVLTNNDIYADKLRSIRSHGIVHQKLWQSDMQSMGYNFRMTEIAASLGCTQINKLNNFIAKRNEIASYYDARFKNETLFSTIALAKNIISSRHLYPILLEERLHTFKEDIYKDLQDNNLGVQIHYRPIYQNSFYKNIFGKVSLPGAELFYSSEISIPCHQKMTLDDATYVADTLLNILSKYANS